MKKKMISALLTALLCALQFTVVFGGYNAGGITPSPIGGLDGVVFTILGVVQWIGFIVGIAMCIYIGIKYLTAGAGAKAEVKSTMIPWLVGALCVALAPTIATTVFTMFSESNE